MKTAVLFAALLAITSALFFFAPHHRSTPNRFKARTLSEIYRGFFAAIPDSATLRLPLFLFLGLAGIATSFYPALFVFAARLGSSASGWLLLGGIVAAVGAVANWLAMLLSDMNFGWGVSQPKHTETVFFWIMPLFQLAFAAGSIALASSDSLSEKLSRWLVN